MARISPNAGAMAGTSSDPRSSSIIPAAQSSTTKAMTWSSSSWLYLLLLCLSRQLSHLVCPGIAALEQFRHWPFSFLCCRAFFPCSRAASFRSAVWFLACSYKRRASRCSSGGLLGFGSFRGFSFLGLGFLTLLAFLGFWLGAGLVSSKRCWKVLSFVRGWGPGLAGRREGDQASGNSPALPETPSPFVDDRLHRQFRHDSRRDGAGSLLLAAPALQDTSKDGTLRRGQVPAGGQTVQLGRGTGGDALHVRRVVNGGSTERGGGCDHVFLLLQ